MIQSDLLSWVPPDTDRHGSTYENAFDFTRLNAQQKAVWAVMRDGEWRTLREISLATNAPEASVSARLRDFRNMFRWTVERKRCERGLHKYRVRVS